MAYATGYPTGGGAGGGNPSNGGAGGGAYFVGNSHQRNEDMEVYWEYLPGKMTEVLHVRIGDKVTNFEYSQLRYPHKLDLIQDVYRKIQLEHGYDVARLFHVEVARYISRQSTIDTMKVQKENEAKKEKENLQSIYLYWAICLIPKIPLELVSSLELAEEAIAIQKNAIANIVNHEKKVRLHYLRFGNMWEKFINYLT